MNRRAFASVDYWESRKDRPDYSEQDPACVVHWNGTQLATFDRAVAGCMARLVLEHHRATTDTQREVA